MRKDRPLSPEALALIERGRQGAAAAQRELDEFQALGSSRYDRVAAWAVKHGVRGFQEPRRAPYPLAVPRWPCFDIEKLREGLEPFRGLLWP